MLAASVLLTIRSDSKYSHITDEMMSKYTPVFMCRYIKYTFYNY